MNQQSFKHHIWTAGTLALSAVTVASLVYAYSLVKEMSLPSSQLANISVSGQGEATAVPDIATVSFSVRESAATVPEAQKLAEAKISAVLTKLASLSVDKKDIKTLSYTINPKYDQFVCVTYPCNTGAPKIVGYEVSQSVSVKVRKIEKAGDVIGALGGENISELQGPTFEVEDKDKAIALAKDKAIKDARTKAEATAKSLGVELGQIISYSEDDGGSPMPVFYSARAMMAGKGSSAEDVSASLPTGENTLNVHVNITYSIDE